MGHYPIWLERYEGCRDRILDELRSYDSDVRAIKEVLEGKDVILPVEKIEDKRRKLCFVDGGEGMRELLGAAIYFIQSSGLILDKKGNGYENEKFVRDLDMNVIDYDEHTKERVELLRGAMEFSTAIDCIKKHKPEYVFIDGSLHVNAARKAVECPEYVVYRKKFSRLLKLSRKNSIRLVGVSEDSKSKLFANYLSAEYGLNFPKFLTDSSILRILAGKRKYRTVEFRPRSRFKSEPAVSFLTAYLQPTPLSNPLRIDTPDWEQDFDHVISLVAELSKGSGHYGYPLPLYLTHLDARIKSKQLEWSTNQLIHYISKNEPSLYETILQKTRRALRPSR